MFELLFGDMLLVVECKAGVKVVIFPKSLIGAIIQDGS